MAIKQRKQLTGTTAQINAYAGVEGQLVWDKTKKKWVGMSGTAGTNYPMASESHTHSISNVTNLQTTLNTIQDKIPTKTSQLSNDSGFLVTHPTISVAAKTLDSGSAATVTKSGTAAAPVFTFGIPKGDKGDKGDRGDTGPQGPAGPSGPTPNAYVTTFENKGTMWYRKWSNGFIEQWDTEAPYSGYYKITFGWPFTSKAKVVTEHYNSYDLYVDDVTTTGFTLGGGSGEGYYYLSGWYAFGY